MHNLHTILCHKISFNITVASCQNDLLIFSEQIISCICSLRHAIVTPNSCSVITLIYEIIVSNYEALFMTILLILVIRVFYNSLLAAPVIGYRSKIIG
jgi:hypothetical protein